MPEHPRIVIIPEVVRYDPALWYQQFEVALTPPVALNEALPARCLNGAAFETINAHFAREGRNVNRTVGDRWRGESRIFADRRNQ